MQQSTISEAVVNNAEEMAAAVVAHYPLANRAFERLLDILPAMTNYAAIPLRNYVSRPSVEDGILQAYNSCFGRDDGVYTVVVGPEGSGKTSTTACMSEHKTGVVHLSMNREDTPSSVLRKILSISGEQLDYKTFQPGLRDLYPLFVLVANKMGGRRLTILLDVDSYVLRMPLRRLTRHGQGGRRAARARGEHRRRHVRPNGQRGVRPRASGAVRVGGRDDPSGGGGVCEETGPCSG
jgi:hypothetical protein